MLENISLFSESLVSILESVKDNVASFGPLARNSEWFLSLKSDAAKDRMMSAGSLKVRGCTFYVRSADKTQFSARVHWAPPFIPNAAIVKVLEETCKLQFITLERSTSKGFEGIPTGIRRLVLTGMLTTCVMSLVLFLRLFNFVLLQARTGCSVRYCVLAVRELV